MECNGCEQYRKDFVCISCRRSNTFVHQAQLSQIVSERDSLVKDAAEAIAGPLYAARSRRADVALLQRRVEDIQRHVGSLRKENESARERNNAKRATLSNRRDTLARANALTHMPPARTPTPTLPGGPPRRSPFDTPASSTSADRSQTQVHFDELKEAHAGLQDALTKARQGLIAELVDVFDLAEVGGRPSLGIRAGARGEWTIVAPDLVFPVPGDIRRYPPVHVNAILTHTLHFLGLLTFYLGVKLPFEIIWSSGRLGLGQPSISAARPGGGVSGGWAKWTEENPLHLPLSSPANSQPLNNTSSPPPSPRRSLSSSIILTNPLGLRSTQTADKNERNKPIPIVNDSASYLESPHQDSEQPASFTTALSMLLFDVVYLAWTQGVEIPLAQTGEILRNLWVICCSAELGKRSHETHPLLPPPTQSNFLLDFKQLLQATTADPVPRPRSRVNSQRASGKNRKSKRTEVIAEEEDWEVVEGS